MTTPIGNLTLGDVESRCVAVQGYIILATGPFACSADGLMPLMATVGAGLMLAVATGCTMRRSHRARACIMLMVAVLGSCTAGALPAACIIIITTLGLVNNCNAGKKTHTRYANVLPAEHEHVPRDRHNRHMGVPVEAMKDLIKYGNWKPYLIPLCTLVYIDALHACIRPQYEGVLVEQSRSIDELAILGIQEPIFRLVQTMRSNLAGCAASVGRTVARAQVATGARSRLGEQEGQQAVDEINSVITRRMKAEPARHGAEFIRHAFTLVVSDKCRNMRTALARDPVLAIVMERMQYCMKEYNELVITTARGLIDEQISGAVQTTLGDFLAVAARAATAGRST